MRVSLLACLYVRVIACHLLSGVQMVSQGTEESVSFCSPGRGHLCWMLAELLGATDGHGEGTTEVGGPPVPSTRGSFPSFPAEGSQKGSPLAEQMPYREVPWVWRALNLPTCPAEVRGWRYSRR